MKNENISKLNKRKTNGFSLFEIIIAVLILSFIAIFSLPSYQVYAAKSQIVESLVLVSEQKNHIENNIYHNGLKLLEADYDVRLFDELDYSEYIKMARETPYKSLYMHSITIGNNILMVFTHNSKLKHIHNAYLELRPDIPEENSNIIWHCISNIPQDYLPNSCVSNL